jgi:predicted TIM-barrel enzyme
MFFIAGNGVHLDVLLLSSGSGIITPDQKFMVKYCEQSLPYVNALTQEVESVFDEWFVFVHERTHSKKSASPSPTHLNKVLCVR